MQLWNDDVNELVLHRLADRWIAQIQVLGQYGAHLERSGRLVGATLWWWSSILFGTYLVICSSGRS